MPVDLTDFSGRRNRQIKYFDSELDSIWKAEYEIAADKDRWLKDKLKERKAIDEVH